MIGAVIKKLRKEYNVTQAELAAYLGVTPKAVSFYELGQREPSNEMLVALAKKFNVTIDYLLGIKENEFTCRSSNKMVMANNIKKYMHKTGKTQKELCTTLGFKESTFSDWVKGKKYPRIDKIERMANFFGISKADLVEEGISQVHSILLSAKEEEIIKDYRQLKDDDREEIEAIIKMKLAKANRKVVEKERIV